MKKLNFLAFLFLFLVSPILSAGLAFPEQIVLIFTQKVNSAIKNIQSNI